MVLMMRAEQEERPGSRPGLGATAPGRSGRGAGLTWARPRPGGPAGRGGPDPETTAARRGQELPRSAAFEGGADQADRRGAELHQRGVEAQQREAVAPL